MKITTADTYQIQIHMAGSIEHAKAVIRRFVYPPNEGLCVTVRSQTFIYTGGEEEGFVIGILNYPRFESTPEALEERAKELAATLIESLCQWTALVVAPAKTYWLNARPDDQR